MTSDDNFWRNCIVHLKLHRLPKIDITSRLEKSSNLVFETTYDHIQLLTKITSQNPIALWLCRSTDNLLKSKLPYCVDLWPRALFPISSSTTCYFPRVSQDLELQGFRGVASAPAIITLRLREHTANISFTNFNAFLILLLNLVWTLFMKDFTVNIFPFVGGF